MTRVMLMQYNMENMMAHRAKMRSDVDGRMRRCVMESESFARDAVGANRTIVA
jgi:hypothetical protein